MKILVFIILMAFIGLTSAVGIILLSLNFSPDQAGFPEKFLIIASLFFLISSISCLIIFKIQKYFSKKPIFQQASIAFISGIIIAGIILLGLLIKKFVL
ncbi:hypothetical protein CL633_02055 [bacterium]|nr:hypothetical protein [bacterium]